jgi:4-amino-4-deoxy-L-arabinose transferase-like glycosyltransferase
MPCVVTICVDDVLQMKEFRVQLGIKSPSNHTHFALFSVVAVLLLAGMFSARLLDYDLMFTDEYLSLRTAGALHGPLDTWGIIDRTIREDNGGMGVSYHVFLGAWEALTGVSPFTARTYSWLFGMLAIAMCYRLGSTLFGGRVGLYSAVILGGSAFFMDYMHEARAYTAFAFFTLTVVWIFLRLQGQARLSWRWYIALTIFVALMLYTHYLALVMGVVLGIYHLCVYRPRRQWWGVIVAMAVGAVLFVPWLGVTLGVVQRGVGETTRHASSMQWQQFIPLLFYAFANANVAFLLIVAWYALRPQTRQMPVIRPSLREFLGRNPLIFVLMWLVIGLLLVAIINARIPFMVHIRYLIFLFPPLALLTGYGIQRLSQAGVSAVLMCGVWLLVGLFQTLNPSFIGDLFGQIYRAPAQGLYEAMEILRQRSTPDDVVLIHITPPDTEPFQLFPMDYLLMGVPNKRTDQFELMNLSLERGDNDYLPQVQTVLADTPFVWTAIAPQIAQTNKSGVVQYVLATQFAECEQVLMRDDAQLRLYTPIKLEEEPHYRLLAPDNGELGVYVLKTVRYGNNLRVILQWRNTNIPQGTYSYSVRLLDDNGTVLMNSDAGISDQRPFGCTSTALNVGSLSLDKTQIEVIVYNWQTLEPLTSDDKQPIQWSVSE